MKVLLVSGFPAFPATAGNRSRIRQLALSIKALGHDLTFVYLESKWEVCDDAAHEKAFGAGNYVKLEKKNWRGKWARELVRGIAKRVQQLVGIEAGYYSKLDRFRDRDFLTELAKLDVQPNVVIIEYVLDSWAFEAFPRTARRVLDAHDAFADRHKDYVARGIKNFWVSFRPESENAGFRRADVVLAIQPEEAQRFLLQLAREGGASNPQVAVVSHFLKLGEEDVHYEIDNSAVFLASDNPSNRNAMQFFVDNVMPHVVSEIPLFDLKLVGSICQAVPDMPNITKLGWVDDAHQVFAGAPLSINPMLTGTGINIKLLDAMASGVPTISTETGARGLPDSSRKGVVVVPDHDARAFAAAVIRFARDSGLRREIGMAAREDATRWNARQGAELNRCLTAKT
jgi:glycosyltransferase involved in cell wall biosynthesis